MEWRELATESRILPRSFYDRSAIVVARELLGMVLVHGRTAGVIVETEAYLGGDDLAAHSARGVTNRTRVIFGPPGHAYVYFIYGMHECLNLVAEPAGSPGCVLIRAAQPLTGIAAMKRRRPNARSVDKLASGPGNLTQAFGITREQNGADVTRGSLVVRAWKEPAAVEIEVTPRIGITHCADWPLRFVVAGNPAVSNQGLPGRLIRSRPDPACAKAPPGSFRGARRR
ncbi:MAG TPA: DNA-3-methyladenine glycosylase [Bryobacteraceae bacterium]|nr:DNA-3-methyladenine glycosylase [Bryobacteraceae bacterium]